MKSIKATLALSLIVFSSAACYKREPLATVQPAPASRVIATLSDSGTVVMGNALGPGAMEVEGIVTRADSEQWILQLLRVDHRDQRSIEWNREPVNFPRRVLQDPQIVVLDKRRSWLAAAGVVIGVLLAASTFELLGTSESDEGGPTPPPPPAEALIPRP